MTTNELCCIFGPNSQYHLPSQRDIEIAKSLAAWSWPEIGVNFGLQLSQNSTDHVQILLHCAQITLLQCVCFGALCACALFKVGTGALVHALATEIYERHCIQAPICNVTVSVGPGQVGLGDRLWRVKVGSAAGPLGESVQTPPAVIMVEGSVSKDTSIHREFLCLMFADCANRADLNTQMTTAVGLTEGLRFYDRGSFQRGFCDDRNESLTRSILGREKNVTPMKPPLCVLRPHQCRCDSSGARVIVACVDNPIGKQAFRCHLMVPPVSVFH